MLSTFICWSATSDTDSLRSLWASSYRCGRHQSQPLWPPGYSHNQISRKAKYSFLCTARQQAMVRRSRYIKRRRGRLVGRVYPQEREARIQNRVYTMSTLFRPWIDWSKQDPMVFLDPWREPKAIFLWRVSPCRWYSECSWSLLGIQDTGTSLKEQNRSKAFRRAPFSRFFPWLEFILLIHLGNRWKIRPFQSVSDPNWCILAEVVHVVCPLLTRRCRWSPSRCKVSKIYRNALGNIYSGMLSLSSPSLIFWKTDEPYNEPPQRLLEAMKAKGLDPSLFHTIKIGETIVV